MLPMLYQFSFSHYNEKARWALDWKRVPHVRRTLLPGPHLPVMRRLSGQKQVPVLRVGDELVVGSATIIDHLERKHPSPALYPREPAARAEALEQARWFDDEVGAQIRRAFFHDFLVDGRGAARFFSAGAKGPSALFYRAVFPLIRMVMRRDMKIDARSAERGVESTRAGLERVARLAGRDGYLVGGAFSVADLTAASLLAVALFPEESPVPVPEPSPVLERWIARFAGDPGVEWVANVYRSHRGRSAEVTTP